MKIQVYCCSAGDQFFKVSITVMEGEDFPTKEIFQNERDFPGSDKYSLTAGSTNTINNIFNSAAIAERWAERQIKCLQDHLKKWRRPDDSQTRILYI